MNPGNPEISKYILPETLLSPVHWLVGEPKVFSAQETRTQSSAASKAAWRECGMITTTTMLAPPHIPLFTAQDLHPIPSSLLFWVFSHILRVRRQQMAVGQVEGNCSLAHSCTTMGLMGSIPGLLRFTACGRVSHRPYDTPESEDPCFLGFLPYHTLRLKS